MKQIVYSMQFKGQAAPVAGSSTVLKAITNAPSSLVTTMVGPEGVSGSWKATAGDKASFESEVTITGETSFLESGSIRVDADTLLFETKLIDSINILYLIGYVEKALGRRLTDAEIVMSNFRSVRVIANTFLRG